MPFVIRSPRITTSEQIANDVIISRHVKNEEIVIEKLPKVLRAMIVFNL